MTEPTDPADPTDPSDSTGPDALDDAGTDALVQRLRTEPVDIDELARERRIAAAMQAATYLVPASPASAPEPATAPVPPARRSGARRGWLVAAAVLAVVGLGGYLISATAGSGGQDESGSAEVASEDAAADSAATADAAQQAPASTTTTPAAAGTAAEADGPGGAELVELGTFADLEQLRAATGSGMAGAPNDSRSVAPPDAVAAPTQACADELVARGQVLAGVASVGGADVLVVSSTPPALYDAATCSLL